MESAPPDRVRRWRAVEPELTHFHDLILLNFDIATDRGTSDTYQQVTTRPGRGGQWPWQRLVLTLWGGPLDAEHRQATPIRCTFVARHVDGTTLPPRGRDHFSGDFNVGKLMMTVVDSSVKSAGDVW